MTEIDLDSVSIRELNQALHDLKPDTNRTHWKARNPRGKHALAVGLEVPVTIEIDGHVGYYCGGMNKEASIVINGQCGWGVGENIMSGTIRVKGNASESAAASGHGGLVIIEGDASSRCGISMKGVDIVVLGSVGHMSAFMGQSGRLVVLGDADEDLGSSLYEAEIYVRGNVASLGADCEEKEMTEEHRGALGELLARAEVDVDPASFKRFGSARKLYHFHVDHADAY